MDYDELVKKWGENRIAEVQGILADENETYQEIEGKFIELDQQGRGVCPEAVELEKKLFVMVDRFIRGPRQKQGSFWQ